MNLDVGMGNALQCPSCGQPFQPQIEQIIDVGRDPSAKARFLSGQTNVAVCPHCGFRAGIATPLLYHDPEKELFLVYVPMELNLNKENQEQLIGQLVKAVMDNTPAEQRRGYMFQPRTMLSLQGMAETILEADGITQEMMEAQRAKVRLVESFLQSDEDALPGLVEQHDDKIDMEFLQIMTAAAENALQSGRQDMAQQAIAVRDRVMQLSSAGKVALAEAEQQEQVIQEVVGALQALGDDPSLDDFVDLVVANAESEPHLQAFVGLQYPLFDYNFFQNVAGRIESASDGDRERLETMRDRLLELTEAIKQQQEQLARASAQVLNQILNSEDIPAAVRQNIGRIDDTFLMVLNANLEAAEERKDLMMSARLKQVAEAVNEIMQDQAPPEFQFVTALLQHESLDDAKAFIEQHAAKYGPSLVQIIDVLAQELQSRGDAAAAERLAALRGHVAQAVGSGA
jgi:hypothetical protein